MAASADGRAPPAATAMADLFGDDPGSPEAVTPAAIEPTPAVVLRPVEVTVLPDGTMRRADAARYLGISPHTLAGWAHFRYGPKFIRVGRKTFYRRRDLDAWKETQASW